MLRFVRTYGWLALLAAGFQTSFGFALLGPSIGADAGWQIEAYGFYVPTRGDVGAPKNLSEEYRWNRPALYYAFDSTFLEYFGYDASLEADKAFAVFNGLTNLSYYSSDLQEFPLQTTRINQEAASLGVLDLKSVVMSVMMEQMGAADPVRYMFNTHARSLNNGVCPDDVTYLVVERNFDPGMASTGSQLLSSHYVNGVLYTYGIMDYCGATPPVGFSMAEALELQPDTAADTRLPVASTFGVVAGTYSVFGPGNYYTGLTRDDVGALRYLMSPNNLNYETAGIDVTLIQTNLTSVLLTNYSLGLLAQIAKTNDPTVLLTYYPGLVITSSSNWWEWRTNSVMTIVYTNYAGDPVDAAPRAITVVSNYGYGQEYWSHTFGNTFMMTNTGNSWKAIPMGSIPTNTTRSIFATQLYTITNSTPAGTPADWVTVVTNWDKPRYYTTNAIAGEFFINDFGTVSNCGFGPITLLAGPFVDHTIDIIGEGTNTLTYTNGGSAGSNSTAGGSISLSYTFYRYNYYTNHVFVARTLDCVADNPAIRQGNDGMHFVRRDFDSLTGLFWYPVTNEYSLNMLTNGRTVSQRFQRVITQPDIVFLGEDRSPTATDGLLYGNAMGRPTNTFNTTYVPGGRSGPGTIDTGTITFSFNTSGVFRPNTSSTIGLGTNGYVIGLNQYPYIWWGKFDGTSAEPRVFPNSTGRSELLKMQNITMEPRYLSEGVLNKSYTAQVSTEQNTPYGWTGPFTWKCIGLPPGLTWSSSNTTCYISGTATNAGFFDFTIRATDASGDSFDQSYYIKIGY
jgi:hypothetical protein